MRLHLDAFDDDHYGDGAARQVHTLTYDAHRALSALTDAGFEVSLVTAGTDHPTPHFRVVNPDREGEDR